MLLRILAQADDTRLCKAVQRLCTGVYHCTITWRSAEELHGVVRIEQGATYSVAVWDGHVLCSCADSRYRAVVCKHAIALALHANRHPKTSQQKEGERASSAAGLGASLRLILSLLMGSGVGRFFFRLGRSLHLRMFGVRCFAGKGHRQGCEVAECTDDLKAS